MYVQKFITFLPIFSKYFLFYFSFLRRRRCCSRHSYIRPTQWHSSPPRGSRPRIHGILEWGDNFLSNRMQIVPWECINCEDPFSPILSVECPLTFRLTVKRYPLGDHIRKWSSTVWGPCTITGETKRLNSKINDNYKFNTSVYVIIQVSFLALFWYQWLRCHTRAFGNADSVSYVPFFPPWGFRPEIRRHFYIVMISILLSRFYKWIREWTNSVPT